ncbi:MAG: hypothetical protein DRQ39_08540 [Gammaproteobacteria bacterium]|nr:MAG: hypothetical protein DRQ39_08540 [Gammaproteobacteria bacterium]RKZ98153.1 MAG: hypothetical protein DRQ42_08990 [Gammaproteobacteria bacterium]
MATEHRVGSEVKPAFSRLFKTADGEIVLSYLRRRFYDNKIDNENIARQVGQRDVVRAIMNLSGDDNGK